MFNLSSPTSLPKVFSYLGPLFSLVALEMRSQDLGWILNCLAHRRCICGQDWPSCLNVSASLMIERFFRLPCKRVCPARGFALQRGLMETAQVKTTCAAHGSWDMVFEHRHACHSTTCMAKLLGSQLWNKLKP